MSASKEESLSPDEMRQKLYQTFKSRGLLDTLKTQLRNQLIQELQAPVRRGESASRRSADHTDSVLVSACNSVVVDHLRSAGYEYTLSVFQPECGLSKDKVLSSRDVLQIMKISPHMPLYKSLVSNIQSGQSGFLKSLLMELTDHSVYRDCSDNSTQTTSIAAHKESLVEKMQLIDEEYEVLRHRGDRWASVEAKLAEYRKEIQEQAQIELNAKLQHFMDVEIAKVKQEEKERSRKEILELRRDMEKTYELKSEALISREKNAIERLQKHQEIEEKDIYAQRQAVLREIESVRSREMELRQRMEAFDKSCALHEEKVKTMEDLLRRRELSVKTMEDSFEQKLKSELLKYQLELKEENMKRTEKLTENEERIRAEATRLQKEAAVIEAKTQDYERTSSEVKQLLMELESSRSQASLLKQQKELLREQLENMRDYPELKKHTLELQTRISLLKQQLEEKQQHNQRLTQELSAPSHEHLMLQAELRRLEAEHKLEKEELETQKNVLHTQLQHEVQQCALLKTQLMECEERTKWMNTHTEELKLQLQQTQQAGPALRGPKSRTVAPEHDSDMVISALSRIRELEQEAERLEEAYRSHQQRALSAEDPTLHRGSQNYSRPTAAQQHRVISRSPIFAGRPIEEEHEEFSRTPSPAERLASPPARRLSSTPQSASRSKRRADEEHDEHSLNTECVKVSSNTDRPALMFPERLISPIPAEELSSSISPSSPVMKSTTRHTQSPAKLQEILLSSSSQESSPQPEKITLHDLTEPIQMVSADQPCLLQDCEPELQQDHPDVQISSSSSSSSSSQREEEQQRETHTLQQQPHEEQTQEQRDDAGGHVTSAASPTGGAEEANPLQRYMQMLMQDKQQEQSPNKESSGSHEENLQSENHEHSAGVISHDEADDDFW
ncbi:centriole and centriolar satellite protein ofd1 isoform 1 [Danio rerio]|uniref:Centriole and centriolar satellite protein ofd1 isoform 1 n=1 Tax=Danio rerio TaxID=7955 RepID=F1QL50_DANRE|nr:centriole and centriolar satellite protein ofd1 isoform 1 [Danio rerio]|eukprot:NP_001306137.1 oral-facial-digital syndrome 1 protein homolog isoform 1 [Danio rerio]